MSVPSISWQEKFTFCKVDDDLSFELDQIHYIKLEFLYSEANQKNSLQVDKSLHIVLNLSQQVLALVAWLLEQHQFYSFWFLTYQGLIPQSPALKESMLTIITLR